MRLGDIRKIISILTFGKGKAIATYIAKNWLRELRL